MDSRQRIILIWILSSAALCLALLYSPWVSPDLYYNQNTYYALNQGVDFSRSGIGNAPRWDEATDEEVSFETQKYGNSRRGVNYTASSYTHNATSNKSLAVAGGTYSRYNSHKSQGSSAGGGASFASGNSSTSRSVVSAAGIQSAFSSVLPSGLGLGQSNVDLSLFGDSTAMQSVDSPRKSLSNPGDEDPLGEPIPVPEGWGFLILLAILYAGYRYKLNVKPAVVQ